MNKESLIPNILLDDADYDVFLSLIGQINDDIKSMISVFPELVHVDNAPEIFLPKLSALIRHTFRYDIDVDQQREVIKRLIDIYRDRGTDDAISMAATYGNDPKWIGSHVFLPGADTSKPRAEITHPIDHIFRHNISKFSSTHRFANATRWREGTLIITVAYIDDKIREAVRKQIPAGLRIYFDIRYQSGGDGEYSEVVFGEWTLDQAYEIDYALRIQDRMEVAVFDVRGSGRRLRSGRQLTFDYQILEMFKGASMLPTTLILKAPGNKKVRDLRLTDIIRCTDEEGNTVYRSVRYLTKNHSFLTVDRQTASLPESEDDPDVPDVPDLPDVPDQPKPEPSPYSIRHGISTYSGMHAYSGLPVPSPIVKASIKPMKSLARVVSEPTDGYYSEITATLKYLFDLDLDDYVYVNNFKRDGELETNYLSPIIHSIDYQINEFDIKRSYRGIPIRSTRSARRSGRFAMSGSYTGEISAFAETGEIVPSDRYYPMTAIADLELGKPLKDYCNPVEVILEVNSGGS